MPVNQFTQELLLLFPFKAAHVFFDNQEVKITVMVKTSFAENQLSGKPSGKMTRCAVVNVSSVRSGKNAKLTSFISPMLATIHNQPFDDSTWVFEVKWDGYRAIAEVGKTVRLYSRNGLSFMEMYPKVTEAVKGIKTTAVLDGEIVVYNKNGKPDFQQLQRYADNQRQQIVYYIFDCLELNGKSVAHLSLLDRKALLHQLIPENHPILKISEHIAGEGKDFFDHVVKLGLEGMIAKKADSRYFPGKRSKEWLKIKNINTQEAIIAGYTQPRGSRECFGALILGIQDHGKLKYIGHTGTGFDQKTLKGLFEKFKSIERKQSPFSEKIPVKSNVTWLDPSLVCMVKYTELTADGILRHPVFMGLRLDKSAREANTIDKPIKIKKKQNQ
jgi:bifunctional non-homologous end joining protein LigD